MPVVNPHVLRIVQINVSERGGGAEAVARELHECYRQRGHDSTLVVGRGTAVGPGVDTFPTDLTTRALHTAAGAARLAERFGGLETYRYPATGRALRRYSDADVVHLHNLHGGYFDLRELPALSGRVPVVLTLHDAWLLSGHCAHSFGCDRWRSGCGACPDLTIYPAVRRDATATNWSRKRNIFDQSSLYVAVPSEWLAAKARASMLAPGIAELRVIPNGVDTRMFTPADITDARRELALPIDRPVLLFVGSASANPFRDPATALDAVALAAAALDRDLTLVVLGDPSIDRVAGRATITGRPFEPDVTRLAMYYQAADLYLHAAHEDTFPTTMLEAMAAGTPAVATAVGGVTEQVRSLHPLRHIPEHGPDIATGILVDRAAPAQMAAAIETLLADESLRARLGRNAAATARAHYDAGRQCDAYLDWYHQLSSPKAAA